MTPANIIVTIKNAWLMGSPLFRAEIPATVPAADRIKRAVELAAISGVSLRGADLADADLRGAHLPGIDLRDAVLCGADLRGANLRAARLRHARLYGADLRGAEMGACDLHRADMRHVWLTARERIALRNLQHGVV